MPTLAKTQGLHGISQLLVHANLLDTTEALEYQNDANARQQSLLRYLAAKGIFSAAQLAQIIAQNFGLAMVDLDCIDYDAIPGTLVSEQLIRRHQVLPLFIRDEHLFLATDDPSNQDAFKEIQFHTGLPAKLLVAETNKLSVFINRHLSRYKSQNLTTCLTDPGEGNTPVDDAPVVQFVNQILSEAVKKGVSDIHFEPFKNDWRIRYRKDGLLMEVNSVPQKLARRISARIKVMSSLDIAERRLPQDGRFQMKSAANQAVDFRVATCPTVSGEKIVMRILDQESMQLDLDQLGLDSLQKRHFTSALDKPQGLILVTGPTGSGKTVSLYTALSILNTIERNISTAEDPVEIRIPGINQVNINPKAGLNFSNILRSLLRQDPDIIMIGEIRDSESAKMAIKAAQTGHLVLSTLHTNSAVETLTRLGDMDIPSFNIATSLSLLVAQRLARRLCDYCKVVQENPPAQDLTGTGFREENTGNVYNAQGCDHCTKGYRGRTGLFEVMPVSKTIGQLIMSGGNSRDILKQAVREGMLTLYQSGLAKIRQGLTTLEEVNRVTMN